MKISAKRIIVSLVLVVVLGWFVWMVVDRLRGTNAAGRQGPAPAPVEVAAVEHGPIELRRTFSGTLESPGQFVVAPKIAGRVERLAVDLGDPVTRGQVVAELDDDEYVQSVAQADAELAVAQANLVEARSSLEIAGRELKRVQALHNQGIGSESELDVAKANQLAKQAAVKVAEAQVTRAEAALSAAKIRLGYTRVAATWTGGDNQRVVARRHVEEGDTVAANSPLLTIVELNPITAVIHLTGKDYGRLKPGLPVTLTTDAYPAEKFAGEVTRVAPVFQQASRQARAEVTVANPQQRLKPGMFVRAEAVLDRVEDATIVPLASLTTRAGQSGVFVINGDGKSVAWQSVQVAIAEGERVQVVGDGITGRVVTLGQQLLDNGSPITIPQRKPSAGEVQTSE
jgi:RND family efflux transporter MFP subunit